MDLTSRDRLAARPGPFASVYIDVSRDHENAEHEIELRWRELVEQLREQDADERTIEAVQAAVFEPAGDRGRAVFATDGEVLVEETLAEAPRRGIARFSTLPHLMPLLAQTPELVPRIDVEVHRDHATIRAFDAQGRELFSEDDEGRTHPVHKVGGGGVSHHVIQHRVEQIWHDNAKEFAAVVDRVVSQTHAGLVTLSGDERVAGMVVDALSGGSREIAVRVGERSPVELATERAAHRVEQSIEDFQIEAGRGAGLVASGLDEVLHALQRNQVRTLLLRDDPSSDLTVWVGTEPMQLARTRDELVELGAEPVGRDRADAALVRAVAGSGAELVVFPHPDADADPRRAGSASGKPVPAEQPELRDGIGAVLRFATP